MPEAQVTPPRARAIHARYGGVVKEGRRRRGNEARRRGVLLRHENLVIARHSASKTRWNALSPLQSIFLIKKMDPRVKPAGNGNPWTAGFLQS
jgi:hypothetical protein